MLFLPLLGAECRAGKEGNFAPSGQRGRRDLAAYAARTRLSLRSIFCRILVPFFCGKMVRNPIQSLSHAPHDSSLYTRKPGWGRGSVASALCTREPWWGRGSVAGSLCTREPGFWGLRRRSLDKRATMRGLRRQLLHKNAIKSPALTACRRRSLRWRARAGSPYPDFRPSPLPRAAGRVLSPPAPRRIAPA